MTNNRPEKKKEETYDQDSDSSSESLISAFDRRKFMTAVGLGTVGATAGCIGDLGGGSGGSDSVDSRFGFIGTKDEDPPVEPDHTVELHIDEREGAPIPIFHFEPAGLFIEPGDTVKFLLNAPDHTVTAYHPKFGRTRRIPEGVQAFSSPVLGKDEYWLYTFEEEGVYDYLCAPHEIFGMVGRIVAGSASGPGANPVSPPPENPNEPRPPELTAGLVLRDQAISPDNIVNEEEVSWDAIASENKRLLIRPVEE